MTIGNTEHRRTILEEADQIVNERENRHGDAIETHERIAALWSALLDVEIDARQAALMLGLLKVARMETGELDDRDHYRDLAGYADCAWRCADADR